MGLVRFAFAARITFFASSFRWLRSSLQGVVGRVLVCLCTEEDNMVVKYEERYSAQYLNFFLKSMERQIITMKLSADQPLIIHYPLGADRSYICFVLAPKAEDDE